MRWSVAAAVLWLAGGIAVEGNRDGLAGPEPAVAVFSPGSGGYAAFRIPALAAAPDGSILAFAEGRVKGLSDSGDIDLVLRRSTDNGRTWGALETILDGGDGVAGNPCPVVDRTRGVIHLPHTRNLGEDSEARILAGTSKGTREIWMTTSTDSGRTWTEPVNRTAALKKADWTWYATGPGSGIQTAAGRLVVPCDYAAAGSKAYGSHIVYSDDGGKTWLLGGTVFPKVNECQIAERRDGTLVLNMRSYHGGNRRAVSESADGGSVWSEPDLDETLVEPVCQAAMIRWDEPGANEPSLWLFSNPASVKRERMTVRGSRDEGRTWSAGHVLWEGPSAYSALVRLPGGAAGCLYERGVRGPYEEIVYEQVEIKSLGKP